MAGFDPNEEDLIVSAGADFVATWVERGVTWPAGTVVTLSFPDLNIGPYVAQNVIDERGAGAYVKVPRADTTAAKLPRNSRYTLHIEKEGTKYLWFRGKVTRQD